MKSTINIRPIIKQDIIYLNAWKNDSEVFKYLGGGFQPVSIDQQEKWLDSMIDLTGTNRRYIITENETPIGMIGLYDINWIHRTYEMGLYIGNEMSHGKGYGTQAHKLIESYARDYLNLRKCKLYVVNTNQAALNFWEKLGYNNVGVLKDERYINGDYHDLVIYEKILVN